MWILLVVWQLDTFATIIETAEECRELARLNALYWSQSGQAAQAMCMRSFEI